MLLMMVQNSFGIFVTVKNQDGAKLSARSTVQKGTLLVVDVVNGITGYDGEQQVYKAVLKVKYNWAGGNTEWLDLGDENKKPLKYYIPCDNNYSSITFKASALALGCYQPANLNRPCFPIETSEFVINLNGISTTLPDVTVISYRKATDRIPCEGKVDEAYVKIPDIVSTLLYQPSETRNLEWYTYSSYTGLNHFVQAINSTFTDYLSITEKRLDGPHFVKVKGCPAQSNTVEIKHLAYCPIPKSLSAIVSCQPRLLTISNCSRLSNVSYGFIANTFGVAPAFDSIVTTSGVPSSTYVYSIPTAKPGSSYTFLADLRRPGYCSSLYAEITYTVPSICGARKSVVNADIVNDDEVNATIILNQNTQSIDISLPNDKLSNISVVNMQGQLVKPIEMNSASTKISISEFNVGTYIVDVKQDGQSFTHKVQVVK